MNHVNTHESERELEPLQVKQGNGGVPASEKHGHLTLNDLHSEEEPLNYKCDEFDDILEIVGSQGTFQKIILYAIICPIVTLEPLFTLNTIFMLYLPDHWCHVPGRGNFTSLQSWKDYTLPM